LKHFKKETQNLKGEENDLLNRMRNIKPTDERTMDKIMSFASTINQTMENNNSPSGKIVHNQKNTGTHLSKTISHKNTFRRESSRPTLALDHYPNYGAKSVF